MDIVLIPGLWLTGAAWDAVTEELRALGHRPVALTLPGQGAGDANATLDDQVDAVLAAVDASSGPCLVVGHSAAATLAFLAADRRPERVASVVFIGGWPTSDGETYADFFPPNDGAVAFPGWEPFEGPDSSDLDEQARQQFVEASVPVPAAVTQAPVHYTDPRRYEVPAVLVCPEFTPAQAREWLDEGNLPELARLTQLSMVDIDSGHWPMVTKPRETARLLADLASQLQERDGAGPER
ncbi:MAG: alpha/beta fold hydrolase [Actinomycetes bacterium]